MKKLFLLDGMALVYRAHFAFSKNPRVNSKGLNTGAILGFTNSLVEIIEKQKPTHLAVAFDTAEPTFRHEVFEEYKANREAQPEDITLALPYIFKITQAFQVPILKLPGYEADDIIGTFVKIAKAQGFDETYMMTIDKDYAQLVEDKVFLYKPSYVGKGVEIWDVAKVLEKFEIDKVEQVIDFLGMQGDAVDNIPGIKGVGKKTAIKFIKEYGSIEGLYENLDKLKGKQKEKVEASKDLAFLSKNLATIKTDVPIEFDEKSLEYNGFNKEALKEVFLELEFRTLSKRLLKEEISPQKKKNPTKTKTNSQGQSSLFGDGSTTTEVIENVKENTPPLLNSIRNMPHNYYLIDTPELRKQLFEKLRELHTFCFDTETSSLDIQKAELIGIAFAWYAQEGYYLPVNEDNKTEVLENLKPIFENPEIKKVAQNLKYDLSILQKYNIKIEGKSFDTMLAHYLLAPEQRHGMDSLARNYLQYQPVEIESLIGKKGKKQGSMKDVPLEKIKEYASEDADITWQLKEIFEPELKKENLEKVFYEVEMPLVEVLAEMETIGVKLDTDSLAEISKELAQDISKIEEKIYRLAGTQFNIASPKQLGEILFDKLKLDPKAKKTKTGQYATGEEILVKLADENEIVSEVLSFRELVKLKNTYVDALPNLVSKKTGRIHTSYNQAVASTGRLSSTNPNLQNIPIRTEQGRQVRKAFIPTDENYVLLSADYSQIELRIMAAFSEDETMLNAFRNGADIHSATASKLYKVSLEEVTPEMRRKAKTANFGIIYGISAHGLSQRLNIPRKESGQIIKAYWEEFPAIKKYMDKVVNQARDTGYSETLLGRKRKLLQINSRNAVERRHAERNAINTPIQGTAADMIKLAMIKLHQFIKENNLKSKMILQVHDELVFDAHISEIEILKPAIEKLMKNALPDFSVLMEVEIGEGQNWLAAH